MSQKLPSSLTGWDVSMAKAMVDNLAERQTGSPFGYYEIKRMITPALVNAYQAGWDDCTERIKAVVKTQRGQRRGE